MIASRPFELRNISTTVRVEGFDRESHVSVHLDQLDESTQEMDTHVGMRKLSTTIGFKLAIHTELTF